MSIIQSFFGTVGFGMTFDCAKFLLMKHTLLKKINSVTATCIMPTYAIALLMLFISAHI